MGYGIRLCNALIINIMFVEFYTNPYSDGLETPFCATVCLSVRHTRPYTLVLKPQKQLLCG